VTAYNGAAPLITSKTLLAAAVGIGLVEGYHAGIVSICPCCAPCPFSQSLSLLHNGHGIVIAAFHIYVGTPVFVNDCTL